MHNIIFYISEETREKYLHKVKLPSFTLLPRVQNTKKEWSIPPTMYLCVSPLSSLQNAACIIITEGGFSVPLFNSIFISFYSSSSVSLISRRNGDGGERTGWIFYYDFLVSLKAHFCFFLRLCVCDIVMSSLNTYFMPAPVYRERRSVLCY